MAIKLERWKNQEDLTSQNFNRRLTELETHFNSLTEKNTKLEEENRKFKEQLDNKADKNIIGFEKISDALNVDRSGLFWCADSTNTPEPHGLLIVGIPWTNDLGFKSLTFISCNNGKMYTRYKFLGNWSPNWVEK